MAKDKKGAGAPKTAPAPAIHDTGTVTVKQKTITVKELTVREILNLANDEALKGTASSGDGFELVALKEQADKYLPQFIEGATVDDLLDMKPSQLREIYDKFMEVNSTFFAVARSMGLDQILEQLKLAVQRDFLKLLADL
jgi:hypothetical protein